MKKFIRHKEDFVCQNCCYSVLGNGYTNHCPECLYSLHVDVNPGDRQSLCGGLMTPIDILTKGGQPIDVVHQCQKCKLIKQNIISDFDFTDAIIAIMKAKVDKEMLR